MPRAARMAVPEMVYHVISRGNDRQAVFGDHEDYEQYIKICTRYKKRYGFKLYHWVLMPNHIHLIMETNHDYSLSKVMQGINLSYTLWFNRRYDRVGHLWQDRFKSAVIEDENYLSECGRYIERNPLRARMVEHPGKYPWSSFKVYAYGERDEITDRHAVYESFGGGPSERQKTYIEYVLSPRDKEEQELREKTESGVLGSEDFGRLIQRQIVDARRPKRGRPKK